MPALPPLEAALVLEPVVLVLEPVALVDDAASGEALDAPAAPAAALGAAEVRGVDVVEAAPLAPKLTAPTASCTLNGGGGTIPLRIWVDALPVEVLDDVVAPALADGAMLLVEPVPPALAPGAALLVEPVRLVDDDVPEVLELLLAMHAALLVPLVPVVPEVVPVAPGAVDAAEEARDDVEGSALLAGRVLVAGDGEVLVRVAPPGAVLGAVAAPVPVLGAALLPPLPQAASRTNEAAATVDKSGFGTM